MSKNKRSVIIILAIVLMFCLIVIIISNNKKEKEIDVNKIEMKVKPDGKPDKNFINDLKNMS